jgi:hypothetical protein
MRCLSLEDWDLLIQDGKCSFKDPLKGQVLNHKGNEGNPVTGRSLTDCIRYEGKVRGQV